MMDEDNIIISKDKLFLLIREMKEYKKELPDVDKNILLKHDLKIRHNLLDKILKEGGIDGELDYILNKRLRTKLMAQIKDDDKDERNL